MSSRILPFPRGSIAQDGTTSLTTDEFKHLIGQTFTVRDTENGTGLDVTLRVVQADVAIATGSRQCFSFTTTTDLEVGTHIAGVAAAGALAKPLDEVYETKSKAIPLNAICYVVDGGPCKVSTTADSDFTLVRGAVASVAAFGKVDPCGDAHIPLGIFMTKPSMTATCSPVVVNVQPGLYSQQLT